MNQEEFERARSEEMQNIYLPPKQSARKFRMVEIGIIVGREFKWMSTRCRCVKEQQILLW